MSDRMLIRGGCIISMDASIGDIPAGDVLIEDGRIAAIASTLDVTDAEIIDATGQIVIPGMVDTHRHTWQTQLRGLCTDWTMDDYFPGIRLTISPCYKPNDVYVGNHLGALEALNAGVTTILDFSHCNNTPEHADAGIAGLRAAGIRALYCYGFYDSDPGTQYFTDHAARIRDFERIVNGRQFQGGLLTPGIARTESGHIPWEDTVAEIRAARTHEARIVSHTGCVWGSMLSRGIRELAAHGLLGPEQIHVHCNVLDDDEWRLLADADAKISISPETELSMGLGRLPIAKCLQFGLRPSLSCDIVSLNSGDLFTQARLALAYQRSAESEPAIRANTLPATLTTTARDALHWMTINGAHVCGLDDEIGSLTPGKQADIVILGGQNSPWMRPQHNAVGSVVYHATPADVDTVLIAGRPVKRHGRLLDVDLGLLLDRADASAQEVLTRARRRSPTLRPEVDLPPQALNEIALKNLAPAWS